MKNRDPRRDTGCTVTWRSDDGHDRAVNETGPTLEALHRISQRIPAGAQVRSISTPRSILRDLTKMPPRYGGSHRSPQATVDPYAFERQMLGKIGRLDLLPDDAYPQGRESAEKNNRRKAS